jgi:putative zinc finger/helix-turn-helix YgiT family protein
MRTQRHNACPVCGEGSLKEVTGEFTTLIDGPDGQIPLKVPGVVWKQCGSCGEDLLDDDASRVITRAHRTALGLLTAEEIRGIRVRLGKTQVQMSELLGIGEKTYCRWESGTHFQSEAFDRYLRLLRAVPEAVSILTDIGRAKEGQREGPGSLFPYLQNISKYETTSERFTELLLVGPFQLQGI